MELHAVLFESLRPAEYRRMTDVLRLSASENSPATPLVVHEIASRDEGIQSIARARGASWNYAENTRKTKHQKNIVLDQPDGTLIGLIDADTMVTRDLSPIENQDFDLAYTVRPGNSKYKLNSGVLFVRCNRLTRLFFDQWLDINLQMLENGAFHIKWRTDELYGGINQAALGWMLQHQGDGVRAIKTLELPCEEWNSVSTTWGNSRARVVHIMGQLRECCMQRSKATEPGLLKVIKQWNEYDQRARQARVDAVG